MSLDETRGRIVCKLKIISELKMDVKSKSDFDIRINGLQDIINDCKIGLNEYPGDPVLSHIKTETENSLFVIQLIKSAE